MPQGQDLFQSIYFKVLYYRLFPMILFIVCIYLRVSHMVLMCDFMALFSWNPWRANVLHRTQSARSSPWFRSPGAQGQMQLQVLGPRWFKVRAQHEQGLNRPCEFYFKCSLNIFKPVTPNVHLLIQLELILYQVFFWYVQCHSKWLHHTASGEWAIGGGSQRGQRQSAAGLLCVKCGTKVIQLI
jgi:hypothetical protein